MNCWWISFAKEPAGAPRPLEIAKRPRGIDAVIIEGFAVYGEGMVT